MDDRFPDAVDAIARRRDVDPVIRFLTAEQIEKQREILADQSVLQTELADRAQIGLSLWGEGGERTERQEARGKVVSEDAQRIAAGWACIR